MDVYVLTSTHPQNHVLYHYRRMNYILVMLSLNIPPLVSVAAPKSSFQRAQPSARQCIASAFRVALDDDGKHTSSTKIPSSCVENNEPNLPIDSSTFSFGLPRPGFDLRLKAWYQCSQTPTVSSSSQNSTLVVIMCA